jgi:hypothetical protein
VSIFGNLFKSQEEIDAIELKKAMVRQKELDEFRRQKLHDIYVELRLENKRKSIKLKNELPIVKASKEIESAFNFLKHKLKQIKLEWEVAYENFRWWDKIKHLGGPDYSEIETLIKELEEMNAKFKEKHGDSLSKLNDHLKHQFNLRKRRIEKAYDHALKVQPQYKNDILDGDDLIRKSYWCAILSVPVSATLDVINAHNVYDTLRHVNKNYLDMSDVEIWWKTLWMAPEKLQGLASLTKGAYFEELVAVNTGGQLFEHFNHPETDIVIDGVEMQIKATDSIDYINSVDDDILVIATSEVALETGSIDGGYTNEELTNTVGLALGGSVLDIPDTAIDGILAGVGGFGLFATLKGLNSARIKYKKGGDDLESFLEGAGVTITQTAKTLVNTSEMVYKVAMSGPSRFIGRNVLKGAKKIVLKGAKKLDEKLFGE